MKIKACPFCGDDSCEVEAYKWGYRVKCEIDPDVVLFGTSPTEAINRWNERALPITEEDK